MKQLGSQHSPRNRWDLSGGQAGEGAGERWGGQARGQGRGEEGRGEVRGQGWGWGSRLARPEGRKWPLPFLIPPGRHTRLWARHLEVTLQVVAGPEGACRPPGSNVLGPLVSEARF